MLRVPRGTGILHLPQRARRQRQGANLRDEGAAAASLSEGAAGRSAERGALPGEDRRPRARSVPAAPEEAGRAAHGGGPTCRGGGMAEREARHGGGVPADPRGVLRKGRAFLDLFWDIAKPEQEVRLAATENLLRHLRDGGEVRRGAAAGGAAGLRWGLCGAALSPPGSVSG